MDATQFSCYHGVLVQFSGLKFAPHISGCNPTFLLPQGVDTIFKSNLHHIQMDATQLSCCHRVLTQFSSLIYITYKWMQPNFLVARGVLMKFLGMISTTCKCMQSNLLVAMGC